ncbi:MAG: hypothetical protein AAF220_02790 [Pseudomonadota bacterium]
MMAADGVGQVSQTRWQNPETAMDFPEQSHADSTTKSTPAFGEDGFTFSDFLDIINPFQHLPVVSTIYRELTGDTIDMGARMAGGALFGGPIGFMAGFANGLVEEETGHDLGGLIIATVFGGEDASEPMAIEQTTANVAALGPTNPGNVAGPNARAVYGTDFDENWVPPWLADSGQAAGQTVASPQPAALPNGQFIAAARAHDSAQDSVQVAAASMQNQAAAKPEQARVQIAQNMETELPWLQQPTGQRTVTAGSAADIPQAAAQTGADLVAPSGFAAGARTLPSGRAPNGLKPLRLPPGFGQPKPPADAFVRNTGVNPEIMTPAQYEEKLNAAQKSFSQGGGGPLGAQGANPAALSAGAAAGATGGISAGGLAPTPGGGNFAIGSQSQAAAALIGLTPQAAIASQAAMANAKQAAPGTQATRQVTSPFQYDPNLPAMKPDTAVAIRNGAVVPVPVEDGTVTATSGLKQLNIPEGSIRPPGITDPKFFGAPGQTDANAAQAAPSPAAQPTTPVESSRTPQMSPAAFFDSMMHGLDKYSATVDTRSVPGAINGTKPRQ